jgi:hypothetical protein
VGRWWYSGAGILRDNEAVGHRDSWPAAARCGPAWVTGRKVPNEAVRKLRYCSVAVETEAAEKL